jgi:6-phosphogluconolactonase
MPRPFDVVLLGMGADGHTASLVPDAAGLARALDCSDPALVRAIDPPDSTGMGPRITLTLRALLDSRWIALLIRGEDKRAAFRHALAGSDLPQAPVRAVLQQTATPVAVYWSP